MPPFLNEAAYALVLTTTLLAFFTLFCVAMARAGEYITQGYALDAVVSTYTWIPPFIGAVSSGWAGFFGAIGGQICVLVGFSVLHAWLNPHAGPTIRLTLNRLVGAWQNYVGLLVTSFALPIFFAIRAGEIFVYPWLVWVLKFPAYNQREWIAISRHKMSGLVGHDLIWCLYCDWMTGVYSLGAEMLRNVESFWCPIKFYDGKKCANCKVDFPDINKWTDPHKGMAPVIDLIEKEYGGEHRSWFGHPERHANQTAVAHHYAEHPKPSKSHEPAPKQTDKPTPKPAAVKKAAAKKPKKK